MTRMKLKTRRTLILLGLTMPLLMGFGTGCGDFWKAPSGGTSSTVTLASSESSTTVGTSITLTATVSPSTATGTVTFYSGTTKLGTGTLGSGTATLATSFSAVATVSLTADYGGDSTYSSSTSSAVSVTVTAAVGTTASTTALSASPNPVATGASVTLTATVTPTTGTATPTGTITFYNGTTSLGTATLSSGTATLSPAPTFSAAGTDSLTAGYSGDSTYAGSTSTAVSLVVNAQSSASDCGYQDSTNSVFATAADPFLSGSNPLSSPVLSVGNADESAICAQNTGTTVTVTSPTIVSTSAGSNQSDSSVYGTSAAVLAYGSSASAASGASISVTGGSITTTGLYSSGVFASGDGANLTLSGTSITTTGANAYAVGASEAGTLNLTNVTAKTVGVGSSGLVAHPGGATITDSGGNYNVGNSDAVDVANPGTVTLTGTTLTSSQGADRGILLYGNASAAVSTMATFTMTNGSISYTCPVTATSLTCSSGVAANGLNSPATVFAIANTDATISLTDVTVTNDTSTTTDSQGTLLTAAALGPFGTSGSNGGNVTFTAQGETLTGDVIVDASSGAALSILQDGSGTPSTLPGAINHNNQGKTVSLTLDPVSTWTVTGDSYLTTLAGLAVNGTTVTNIEGGSTPLSTPGLVLAKIH